MMQLRKPHAHLNIICFSAWIRNITNFVELSRFSAQISGCSADFHRKSVDIVKQHPNNAAIWANSCFSPVIIHDIGEHKFDGYGSEKKLGVGKWKKIGVLVIQKVAKTGNIGKKNPVVGDIEYVRYLSMQKLTWIKRDNAWNDTRLKVNKH